MPLNWVDITLLSLKVALVATLFASPISLFLGLFLARSRSRCKPLLETIILLPMVLPPVSVGLLLLYLLKPQGPFGALSARLFGQNLLLTWQAAAIASMVVALPLMIKAAEQAFVGVPHRLEQVAGSLGLSPIKVLIRVTLPLARNGLFHASLLGFARALGEFGATNLVAGLIPGRTETLALGIYDRITNGHDQDAWILTAISLTLAFGATLFGQLLLRRNHFMHDVI